MDDRIRPARPEDAAAIARVNGDTWRATYRGIFPDAVLERRGREPDAVERRRKWLEEPATLAFVAEEGGEVVGIAAAGPPRAAMPGYDAELFAIYVLPASQGTGLGRGLVEAVAGALAKGGSRSLFLWVLRDNPGGRGFYERLEGRLIAERTETVEGVAVAEVAYGWPDLGPLAGAAGTSS